MSEESKPVEAAAPEAAAPEAAAAPAAEAKPAATGWLTQVPKELREHPALVKHGKMQDLLQEYIGLASKQDRALYVPGKDAPPEELDAFLAKMGIPKGKDGYTLDEATVKDLPNGKEFLDNFKDMAHGAGMTRKQAEKALAFVASLAKAGGDAQKAAERQTRETFDRRLLESMEGSEPKAQEAKNRLISFMTKRVGDQELVKDMAKRGILYDPRYVRLFASLEERMGDAPFIDGRGPGPQKAKSEGTQGNYSQQWKDAHGGRK